MFIGVHSVWKETEKIRIFEFLDGVKTQPHQLTYLVLDRDRLNYPRWVFLFGSGAGLFFVLVSPPSHAYELHMLACISVAVTEEQEQKGTAKVQWNNNGIICLWETDWW